MEDKSQNQIAAFKENDSLGQRLFQSSPILPDDSQEGALKGTQLSLSEASKISGLHQDYLRFLCRTGKLQGEKIGRNWTTTREALKGYQNTSLQEGEIPAEDSRVGVRVLTELPRDLLRQNEGALKIIHNETIGQKRAKFLLTPKTQKPKDEFDAKELLESLAKQGKKKTKIVPVSLVAGFAALLLFMVSQIFGGMLFITQSPVAQKMPVKISVSTSTAETISQALNNKNPETQVLAESTNSRNVKGQTTNSSNIYSEEYFKKLIYKTLTDPYIQVMFKGEKGEKGDSGKNILNIIDTVQPQGELIPSVIIPGGYTQPYAQNNLPGMTLFSAVEISAQKFYGETGTLGDLTVTGTTNLNGTVNINGTLSPAQGLNLNFSTGSVVFQSSGGLSQDNSDFFYNASTTQLSIGTNTPESSAILELASSDKGFLAPRMAQTQRDAIASPASGLMVYNTDTNQYNVYNGSAWGAVGGAGGSGGVATGTPGAFAYYNSADTTVYPQSALFLSGSNVGIGTTLPASVLFIQGSSTHPDYPLLSIASSTGERMFTVISSGNVGIGTTSPSSILQTMGDIQIGSVATATAYGLLFNSGNGYQITLKATSSLASSYTLTLPTTTPVAGNAMLTDADGELYWGTAGSSLSGGINGYATRWLSDSTVGTGIILDNGAVAGINATNSTTTLMVMGSGTLNPFAVASSDGSNLLTVTAEGYVGIGKSPDPTGGASQQLTINGGIGLTNTAGIYFKTSGGTYISQLIYSSSNNLTLGSATAPSSGQGDVFISTSGVGNAVSIKGRTGNVGIGTTAPQSLLHINSASSTQNLLTISTTTNQNIFNILANGNVGIGTASPGYTLDVSGSQRITGGLNLGSATNATTGQIKASVVSGTSYFEGPLAYFNQAQPYSSASDLTFLLRDVTKKFEFQALGGGALVDILNNGNVGIGTTTPSARLSINGSSAIDPFDISSTSGVSMLRFTQNGNLGIGTSAPISTFAMVGSNASSTLPIFQVGTSTNGTIFNILQNGNVGIGMVNPTRTLDVNGSIKVLGLYSVGGNITTSNNGTAGGPAIGLSSGQNTGLFAVSTNVLGFSAGGVEQMRISSGNLGIGTTSPSSILQTMGDIQIGSVATSTAYGLIFNNGNTTTPYSVRLTATSTQNTSYVLTLPTTTPSAGNAMLTDANGELYWGTAGSPLFGGINGYATRWLSDSTVGTGIILDNGAVAGINATNSTTTLMVMGSGTLNPFAVASSNGSNLLTVTAEGNVGIGTTNPRTKFDVSGSNVALDIGSAVGWYSTAGAGSGASIQGGGAFGGTGFISLNTHSIQRLYIVDSGNVGIGTTAPQSLLHINSASSTQNLLTISTTTNQSIFNILANGKVGIGTESPGYTLDVNGVVHTSQYFYGNIYGTLAAADTSSNTTVKIRNTNLRFDVLDNALNPVFSVLNSGNVGIGTTSPDSKLTVTGTSSAPTAMLFNVASDTNASLFNVLSNGNVGIGTSSPISTFAMVGSGSSATSPIFQVGTSTNGSIFNILQNGNVGIGKVNPGYNLEVIGTTHIQGNTLINGGNLSLGGNNITNVYYLTTTNGANLGSTGGNVTLVTGGGNVGIDTTAPSSLLFVQNMGSGSTTPLFSVASSTGSILFNIAASGSINIGTTTDTSSLAIQGTAGQIPNLFNISSSSGVSLFTITSLGNIGIGTSTPNIGTTTSTALVHMVGTTPTIALQDTSDDTYGMLEIYRDANSSYIMDSTGDLQIGSGGDFILDGSIKLGIGTDDPSNPLTITSGGASIGFDFNVGSPANGLIVEGNVGIGTSSPAQAALTITGSGINQAISDASTNWGIYLAPTSTIAADLYAADYRALEIAPYVWTLSTTTAITAAYGSRINAYTLSTTTAATITVASTFNITGAPIASSSVVTIASSSALSIQGGNVSTSSGVVQNAYGLYLQAPTGATNNYAAAFMGGNFGINSSTPSGVFVVASSTSPNTTLMTVTAEGNVGIGTASPIVNYKLHVNGNVYVNGSVGSDATVYQAGDGTAAIPAFRFANDNSVGMWRPETNTLAFSTNGEKMRIDSVGNVGIGTTSPDSKLTVTGTSSAPTAMLFNVASDTNISLFNVQSNGNVGIGTSSPVASFAMVGTNSSSTLPIFQVGTSTNSTIFNILANGNAGIGTTNPGAYKLYVNGMTYSDGAIISESSIVGYNFKSSGAGLVSAPSYMWQNDTDTGFYNPAANNIGIVTYGVEALRIDSLGNVGIGTTAPTSTLFIQGTSTTPILSLITSTTAQSLYVANNGNVGIGTTSPESELDVKGVMTVSEKLGAELVTDGGFDVPTQYTMPTTGVNTTEETITFSSDPGWVAGNTVQYFNGGGSSIGGLNSVGVYYVKSNTAGVMQLSLTNGGGAINLTGTGNNAQYFIKTNWFSSGSTGGYDEWNLSAGTASHWKDAGYATLVPTVPIVPTIGATYKIQFTVSNYSVYGFSVNLGGNNGQLYYMAPLANGTYTLYITAATTGTLQFAPRSTGRFDIDNVSVKQVLSGITSPTGNTLVFNKTLSDPLSNEIAYEFNYTVNKATSGTSAGLLVNANEITAGSVPFSIVRNGNTVATISNGGSYTGGYGYFTGQVYQTQGIAATPTTGFSAANTTAATVGAQSKISPSYVLQGSGWNTTSGASKTETMQMYMVPNGGATTTADLVFANMTIDGTANGNELMRIQSGGNVGIGTTSPDSKLTVTGTSSAPTAMLFNIASNTNVSLFNVQSSGNVGIGTTSPVAALSVTAAAISATQPIVSIGTTTNGSLFTIFANGNVGVGKLDDSGKFSIYGPGSTDNGATNGVLKLRSIGGQNLLVFGGVDSTDSYFGRMAGSDDLAIGFTNSPEAIRIKSVTGNIGIGTSTPNAKLAVSGTINDVAAVLFNVTSSTGASLFNIQSTGNAGVGTGAPGAKLHVIGPEGNGEGIPTFTSPENIVAIFQNNSDAGGNAYMNIISGTGGYGGFMFGDKDDPYQAYIQSLSATDLRFGTGNGNLAMLINSTGNIGIGTTGPLTTLDVNGSFQVNNGSIYYSTTTGITSIDALNIGAFNFDDDAGQVSWADMRVTASSATSTILSYSAQLNNVPILTVYGKAVGEGSAGINNYGVGIGTTSPLYLLHVGDATASGTVARFENSAGSCDINPMTSSLVCPSDINKKKNVVDLGDALTKVMGLKPVWFNWKNEDASSTAAHSGFIAQDVEKVLPELVYTDGSGTKSLGYSNFVPFLAKAIQQQQDTINNLQLTINNLQGSNIEGNAESSGAIAFKDHLYLSGDSVGQARILPGANFVRINFEKPYEYQPIVTITPINKFAPAYVKDADATGFTIEIDREAYGLIISAPAGGVEFNWHAFAGAGAKLTVSDGNVLDINLVAGQSPAPGGTGQADSSEADSGPSGASADSSQAGSGPPGASTGSAPSGGGEAAGESVRTDSESSSSDSSTPSAGSGSSADLTPSAGTSPAAGQAGSSPSGGGSDQGGGEDSANEVSITQ